MALTQAEKDRIRGMYGQDFTKLVEAVEAQGSEVTMAPGDIAVIQPKDSAESVTLVDLANAEKALRDAVTPRFEKGPNGVMTMVDSGEALKQFYMGLDPGKTEGTYAAQFVGSRYEVSVDMQVTAEQFASVLSQLEASGALLGPTVATADGLDEAMGVKFAKPVVETSTLNFSAQLDEIVSNAARELLPPGIATQAIGLLKRQLAMLWLGYTEDSTVTFERMSIIKSQARKGLDLEEWELEAVGDTTRVSILFADQNMRNGRMNQLRDMATRFGRENARYTVIFVEEKPW